MKYLAYISYDGSSFDGFQTQINKRCIEKEIETALQRMTQCEIKIVVAGRTDKGVHAIKQAISFETTLDIAPSKWVYGLNIRLTPEIRILEVLRVENDFHARHSCIEKTYVYKISKSELTPFTQRYYAYVGFIDIKKMNTALQMLVGTHDFLGFCSRVDGKETIKTINKILIEETDECFLFYFYGKSFLRHMIRIIMGVVNEIGQNKKDIGIISEILETCKKAPIKMAPPNGLYLFDVKYNGI